MTFFWKFLNALSNRYLKVTCEQLILIQFYHAQVSLVQKYINRLGYLGNENLLILILISLAEYGKLNVSQTLSAEFGRNCF